MNQELIDLMTKHQLTPKQVSELTLATLDAVYKWKRGDMKMDPARLELLKIKLNGGVL